MGPLPPHTLSQVMLVRMYVLYACRVLLILSVYACDSEYVNVLEEREVLNGDSCQTLYLLHRTLVACMPSVLEVLVTLTHDGYDQVSQSAHHALVGTRPLFPSIPPFPSSFYPPSLPPFIFTPFLPSFVFPFPPLPFSTLLVLFSVVLTILSFMFSLYKISLSHS